MENYQTVTIIIGITFIIVGLAASFIAGWWYGIVVATVSFIGIIASLVEPNHHVAVGITLIVLGVIGNLFLIIPGIMVIRYKPRSQSLAEPIEN
jgi:hypothetical protein